MMRFASPIPKRRSVKRQRSRANEFIALIIEFIASVRVLTLEFIAEPTHMDSKARRKGKGKGRTYIAFLYHACQALGVRITADGPFKVDIRNGDLERLERMKILDIFNDGLGRNAQSRLDNEKLELKEYTKEAVRYRDRLKIVEKIASKQFAHNGAHAEGSRK